MRDAADFENQLIDDMRANGGAVTRGPLAGHPLLILTSRGARSGEQRRAILTWSRDRGDYIVAGTAGGSPTTPRWVYNLRSHPDVLIELGNRTIPVHATLVDGPERDRLWQQHVETLPWFGDYPKKTGRVFPMIRLSPSAGTTTRPPDARDN